MYVSLLPSQLVSMLLPATVLHISHFNKGYVHPRHVILSTMLRLYYGNDLGSHNRQDYISSGCVLPLFKWDLCSDWDIYFKNKYIYEILGI